MAEKKKRSPKPSTAIFTAVCSVWWLPSCHIHKGSMVDFLGMSLQPTISLRARHGGLVTLRLFQVENARDIAHVS